MATEVPRTPCSTARSSPGPDWQRLRTRRASSAWPAPPSFRTMTGSSRTRSRCSPRSLERPGASAPRSFSRCDPTAWFFGNRYFNHSDHRTAGAVTLDAVFPGAGNPHFFTEQLTEGLSIWKVPEVWMGWTLEPNHYQDVTGFMDLKLKALAEHRSQLQGGLLGLFEEWLPTEAEENGRKIGVQHAEAFRMLQLE